MSPSTKRLIKNWMMGAVVGTLVIAVTSPLFVRSYLPLQADEQRGVWTLTANRTYRWRSEGYANTAIGPHGMPGRSDWPEQIDTQPRVVLWGDSQAEGVAVADHDKLFAQADRESLRRHTPITVLPLTRSGEDVADWLTQMSRIELSWNIDAHAILLVDLEDLQSATQAPLDQPSDADQAQAKATIAKWLPAFAIQAARHLLTEPDEVTPRKLRFSLGPVTSRPDCSVPLNPIATFDWQPQIDAIVQTTNVPVVIVYAPKVPHIMNGKWVTEDRQADAFARFQKAATASGLVVVDVREQMRSSAVAGQWPHGFHNGQFGVGHLNATGYRIVANALVDGVASALQLRSTKRAD